MKTYTNTKEIPAKLLYDLLLKSFATFYNDATKKNEAFNYGLGEDVIAIEKPDGTQLYTIDVDKNLIRLNIVTVYEPTVNEQLERFIESCLL